MRARPRSSLVGSVAALTAIALSVFCSDVEAGPAELSEQIMHSLVNGYAHAIETNNLELALWYIHPRSPTRSEIDAGLRGQLSAYLEKARIAHLEPVEQPDGTPAARVDQQLVRVFGLKILHAERSSVFHFRALGESWRIWGIDKLCTD